MSLGVSRIEFGSNPELDKYLLGKGRFAGSALHPKAPPAHVSVLLPPGAPEDYFDPETLFTAMRMAERRRDAQLYAHLMNALPGEQEVTHVDRVNLAEGFVGDLYVKRGLAAIVVIHAPEPEQQHSFHANWHNHNVLSTRVLTPDGFYRLKDREAFAIIRKGMVTDAHPLGEMWRRYQNEYFEEKGYQTRVDPNGLISQIHLGPVRYRRVLSEPSIELALLIEANREATFNVPYVLKELTKYNATFDVGDLDRLLEKQLGEDAVKDRNLIRAQVLGTAVPLYDSVTKRISGRFTTQEVIDEERAAVQAAQILRDRKTGEVPLDIAWSSAMRRTLQKDQADAFEHAIGPGSLKLIVGRAGTGKSYTMAAIRDAHILQFHLEDGKKPFAQRRQVWGLAPTHIVVQDMKANGFSNFATIQSTLNRMDEGMTLPAGSVLMVDEVGMLSTPMFNRLLQHAVNQDLKLVLVGDDRQLASIERGGLLPELLRQQDDDLPARLRNYVELTEIMRQTVPWQKEAASHLANYDFDKAIELLAKGNGERDEEGREKGAIHWNSKDKTESDLVEAWKTDSLLFAEEYAKGAAPEKRHEPLLGHRPDAQLRYHQAEIYKEMFAFAYTNVEVDRLNEGLRAIRVQRGELDSDVEFTVSYHETPKGVEEELHKVNFAVGDRIQFTKNALKLPKPIFNSQFATITGINAKTGDIEAIVDGGDAGPELVQWNAHKFNGFRHGYAGTIHKVQGRSLKSTYLHHSEYWEAAPSYVALTRQTHDVKIFVARETARDTKELASQMARSKVRSAAIAWVPEHELEAYGGGQEFAVQPSAIDHQEPLAAAKEPPAAVQVSPIAIKQENTGSGGIDGMDVDTGVNPLAPPHVPMVAIKQENTGSGGIDGMDVDPVKPVVASQPPVVAIKQENTGEGGFGGMDEVPAYNQPQPHDENWLKVEAGKARFRERLQKYQAQWEGQVGYVLEAWNERVLNFHRVRFKRPGDLQYRKAREELLAYGQFLAGRAAPGMPTNAQRLLSAELYKRSVRLTETRGVPMAGKPDQPIRVTRLVELQRILKSSAPDQAIADVIKRGERQRELRELQSRPQHVQDRYNLRPRGRGR